MLKRENAPCPRHKGLGQQRENRKSPRPPQQAAGREILQTSKVLPPLPPLQNVKRSYFFFLLSFLVSTECCGPRALSQQAARRGHDGTSISPSVPPTNTGAALNGVTEVRLEMLTNAGEAAFTNRIQETTWEGGANKPATGITPQYKPAMSHPQKHAAAAALDPAPAPALRGSTESIAELGQLRRKRRSRADCSAPKRDAREDPRELRAAPGAWGRSRGAVRCCCQGKTQKVSVQQPQKRGRCFRPKVEFSYRTL